MRQKSSGNKRSQCKLLPKGPPTSPALLPLDGSVPVVPIRIADYPSVGLHDVIPQDDGKSATRMRQGTTDVSSTPRNSGSLDRPCLLAPIPINGQNPRQLRLVLDAVRETSRHSRLGLDDVRDVLRKANDAAPGHAQLLDRPVELCGEHGRYRGVSIRNDQPEPRRRSALAPDALHVQNLHPAKQEASRRALTVLPNAFAGNNVKLRQELRPMHHEGAEGARQQARTRGRSCPQLVTKKPHLHHGVGLIGHAPWWRPLDTGHEALSQARHAVDSSRAAAGPLATTLLWLPHPSLAPSRASRYL